MPPESRPTGRNTPRHGNHTGETAETRTGPRIGSLFSGAGGLDMAVETAFGGHTVWHAEIDKAASKVLAHRWPDVPNLGSVTEIDWAAVEPVDVLCGGFPCQDVSAAGKRAGIKDGTRSGLWAVFAEAIDQLRPRFVVVENVRGLLSAQAHRNVESDEAALGDGSDGFVLRAIGAVVGDLADLGYVGGYVTVAAADVGAPHRRERVFIVATATNSEGGAGRNAQQHDLCACDGRSREPGVSNCGSAVRRRHAPHSPRNGRHEGRAESAGIVGRPDAALGGHGDRVGESSSTANADRLLCERGSTSEQLFSAANSATRWSPSQSKHLLLPTPQAADGIGGKTSDPDTRRANGHSVNLSEVAINRLGVVALLPTPCARDFKDANASPGAVARKTPSLGAVEHYLPTPAAADGQRGQDFARANRDGSGGDDLVTLVVKADNGQQWGKYEPAIRRWENLTRPAPAPTEPNKNGNPRLSAAFSEWMLGWPAGWVTDPAIGISRNDQLRIVGNGVCPQQAVAALRFLIAIVNRRR